MSQTTSEGTADRASAFKARKIGVVMLGTRNLARSKAFYAETLGLVPQGEAGGEFAFFEAGGITLALSAPLAERVASEAVAGALEVVFAVEDVTAGYEALRSRGVRFLREPRQVTGESWSAVFTDPDGHHLSLFGPRGGARQDV